MLKNLPKQSSIFSYRTWMLLIKSKERQEYKCLMCSIYSHIIFLSLSSSTQIIQKCFFLIVEIHMIPTLENVNTYSCCDQHTVNAKNMSLRLKTTTTTTKPLVNIFNSVLVGKQALERGFFTTQGLVLIFMIILQLNITIDRLQK